MTGRLAIVFPAAIIIAFLAGAGYGITSLADATPDEEYAVPYPIQQWSPVRGDPLEVYATITEIDEDTGETIRERQLTVKTDVEEYMRTSANRPPEPSNRTIQYLSELRDGDGEFVGEQYYSAKSERAVYDAETGNRTYDIRKWNRAGADYTVHRQFLRQFLWPIAYEKTGVVVTDGERHARYEVDTEASAASIVDGEGHLLVRERSWYETTYRILVEADFFVVFESPETGERTRWEITYNRRHGGPFQPPAWVDELAGDRVADTNENVTPILEAEERYINTAFMGHSRFPIPDAAVVTLVTDAGEYTVPAITTEGQSRISSERSISNLYLYVKDGELTAANGDNALRQLMDGIEPVTTLGEPKQLRVTHGRITYLDQPVQHAADLHTTVNISWLRHPDDAANNQDVLRIAHIDGDKLLHKGNITIHRDDQTLVSHPHEKRHRNIERSPDEIILPGAIMRDTSPVTEDTRLTVTFEGATMVDTALPMPPEE